MNRTFLNFLTLLFISQPLQSTITVKGDAALPLSFNNAISTQVFDRPTGTFFVGLGIGVITETDPILLKALRQIGKARPAFITIKDFQTVGPIEFLTLATKEGNLNPNLAFVRFENNVAFEGIGVFASNNTGSTLMAISESLNDASGTSATSGIVGLEASEIHIFAVVRPANLLNFGDVNFGAVDGGVALMSLDPDELTITIRDANTGLCGNKAVRLDKTSVVLKGSGDDVSFPNNTNTNKVATYWDEKFERLYIGVRILTNNIGRSVVVGRIDSTSNNKLVLEAIVAESAIFAASDEIIVAAGAATNLTTKHVRVLHASTGPSYLVVNGDANTVDNVGNKIYALPLVNNPSSPSTHGTLAKKDAPLNSNCYFITPATNPGDLATNTDPAAIVGAGDFPIEAGKNISDIMVVGDTVYVSSANPADVNNTSGIFYSQALFDDTGKIVAWTPWTPRAFPATGFDPQCDAISFFAVDAVTNQVWAVDSCGTTVKITNWTRGQDDSSLVSNLNKTILQCGTCSALDLGQATRGFVCNTLHRYALFGGINHVVFARTGQATQLNTINSPQNAITDFTSNQNLITTTLPDDPGKVTSLEYSRRESTDNTNYFFAGTNEGLFVFGNSGFNASDLSTLDQPPFSNNGWVKAPNISGSIIDIKSAGNSLYVVTYTTTAQEPMKSTVYRIPFASTVAAMFSPANIITIAESGVGSLVSTLLFSSIGIMTTNSAGTTEQLVLATNQGLYQSSRASGVQGATDQNDAAWITVDQNNTLFFNGIAQPGNATTNSCVTGPQSPQTKLWPFSLAEEKNGCGIFNRSRIYQLIGTGVTTPFVFKPQNFISIEQDNEEFQTTHRINYLWSDGARRIAIVNRCQECSSKTNKLLSLPIDTLQWNSNGDQILFNPILDQVCTFNWIENIEPLGILLVGTNKGIVSLE